MNPFDALATLGRASIRTLERLGRGSLFFLRLLAGLGDTLRTPSLLVRELYSVGVRTLLIILVAGIFVGMVLGLQGYNTLVDFGAEESLGAFVGMSLIRELGPVISGLLFAGRAGSALTAEIGLMKATEQLDGIAMMAVDPIKRVVAPRFLAGAISLPLLAAIFTAVGILGGHLVGVGMLGVDDGAFWSQMQSVVEFEEDVLQGVIIKSVVFAIVVTLIAVFEGYDAVPTSEGVSSATTRTVVNSSLAVLGLDFLLTALMFD